MLLGEKKVANICPLKSRQAEIDSDSVCAANIKSAVSLEGAMALIITVAVFALIASVMGSVNMMSTIMNTAYDLLVNTVLFIMAIAVLAGAVSEIFSEFGIVSLVNKVLSPLMKPLYGLPGAAVIGVVTCYMSDNPAILTLAGDNNFKRYFKKYQLPALTNIGTSFGMGLIVTAFMVGIPTEGGENFVFPALVGNLGAVIGSIISVRLMLRFTSKKYGKTAPAVSDDSKIGMDTDHRVTRSGGVGKRLMDSMLDGGKAGVDMGFAIIPGVLIICTIVLLLTNGPSASGAYTGSASEGIGLLPYIGERLEFILKPLFGFSSPEAIAVPVTALGAAGAAIGLVPGMVTRGLVHSNDIAVFTAMCMCWSGYLSTHVAMMDGLKFSEVTHKAILYHTIGGLVAGVSANLLYKLFSML